VEHWEKFNSDPQLSAIDQRLDELANKITEGQESEASSSSASRSGTPKVKSPDLALKKSYRSKKPVPPPPATPLQPKVSGREFGNEGSEASGYATGNDPHDTLSEEEDDEQHLLKGKQKVASPALAALHQDRAYQQVIRDDDDNDSDYEFLRLKPPIYIDVVEGTKGSVLEGRKLAQNDSSYNSLGSSTSSNREHPPSYPPPYEAEGGSRAAESNAYHALAQVLTQSVEQRKENVRLFYFNNVVYINCNGIRDHTKPNPLPNYQNQK
jgi:hypothetical protein